MAVLGKIVTVLSANTAQFEKGLNRAKRRMHKFGQDVVRVGGQLAGLGMAAGAAALGGLAMMTKSGLESVDALAKTSDMLGISTEQLAAFQHAAKIAGVEQSALEMALRRMTIGIGEAAMGTGEAKDAIRELGLTADDLMTAGPYQAFRRIADALSKVTLSSRKAALAADLFGSRGLAMINMMSEGSRAIDEAATQTVRFGTAISRVDASKVEAANDAMSRLSEIVEGLKMRLAIELAPYIEDVTNRFINWATEGEGAAGKITTAIGWIVDALSRVVNAVNYLRGTFLLLKATVEGLAGAMAKSMASSMWVAQIGEKIPGIGDALHGLRMDLEGIAKVGSEDAAKDLEAATEAFDQAANNRMGEGFKRWADQVVRDANARAAEIGNSLKKQAAAGAGGTVFGTDWTLRDVFPDFFRAPAFAGAAGKRSLEPTYKAKPEVAEPPAFGLGGATAIAINRRAYASVAGGVNIDTRRNQLLEELVALATDQRRSLIEISGKTAPAMR